MTPPLIDRRQVVARHIVRLTTLDPFNPLTVGNGEFAFTADVTGLQTFPDAYAEAVPLCTMSQWGWHSTPAGADVKPDAIRYTDFDTYGRAVPYVTSAKGQEATFAWLRENATPFSVQAGEETPTGLRCPERRGRSTAAAGYPASPSVLTSQACSRPRTCKRTNTD